MSRSNGAVRPPDHPVQRLVAWLTLLAIAGTLCACGRYGPPKRRPQETMGAQAETSCVGAPGIRVLLA